MMERWDYYGKNSKWERMRKATPATRAGWAAYYDLREGPEAEHLCYWYLLLAHFYGEL